jgi:hypothetical protein
MIIILNKVNDQNVTEKVEDLSCRWIQMVIPHPWSLN